MANLGRYSDNEGASVKTATEWTVSTRLDISSAAHAYKALNERTQYITVYADWACYFRFDVSSSDTISATNDPQFAVTTLTRIKVPRGRAGRSDTLYFHAKATSSQTTKYLRIVEE